MPVRWQVAGALLLAGMVLVWAILKGAADLSLEHPDNMAGLRDQDLFPPLDQEGASYDASAF